MNKEKKNCIEIIDRKKYIHIITNLNYKIKKKIKFNKNHLYKIILLISLSNYNI